MIEMVGGPADGSFISGMPNHLSTIRIPVEFQPPKKLNPNPIDLVPVKKYREMPVRNGRAHWYEGKWVDES